ncbi:MAG: peptidylprolyl isomerase [Cyanobacteria bacterium]|nr:peptidylprolyl isomerase [Cyanobacteriota bacterium]
MATPFFPLKTSLRMNTSLRIKTSLRINTGLRINTACRLNTVFSRLVLVVLLLLSPFGLAACAGSKPTAALGCAAGTFPCLKGKAVILLTTNKGEVQLSLDGDNAPLTAGNFVDLVGRGLYNGTLFHRVVKEPVPFVVQGGDPLSADVKVNPELLGSGGFIDPATGQQRQIPLEILLAGDSEPHYGAPLSGPGQQARIKLVHARGSVAMARSNDPNSASSQFYVALRSLPELDGRYAVFGQVTKGIEVVDQLVQGDKLIKAVVVEGGTLVKEKP